MALFDDSKKKFELLERSFFYNGQTYNYDDIRHISYKGIVTDVKLNFMSVDELNEALCVIKLKNGKTIRHNIEEKPYLVGFSQEKKSLIEDLARTYTRLSRESFMSRLAGYQHEFQQHGHFTYPGADIHAGKIILHNDRRTTFTTSDSKFSRTSSEFIMTRTHADPNMSLANKLLRKAFRVGMEIEERLATNQDIDIFYYLIAKCLGIRFS